jgi:hypothetical protein
MERVGDILELLVGDRRVLWLDSSEYASRLSGRDSYEFDTSVTDFVLAIADAQRLLGSDVVSLKAEPFYGPRLAEFLGESIGKDTVTALRELWRSGDGVDALRQVIDAVANMTAGSAAIALVIPSPSLWLTMADSQAEDEDTIDTLSVYLAEHLRNFSDSQISAVVLDEGSKAADAWTVTELYRPILNLAHHYGWASGVASESIESSTALLETVDFVLWKESSVEDIAPEWRERKLVGGGLARSWWADNGPLPDDLPPYAFGFGTVPRDVEPEVVLECVERWRTTSIHMP